MCTWLYYSSAKCGYCCKVCELFAPTNTDNVFISGTKLGDHPTRKLDSHLAGKCHADCTHKYDLTKVAPAQAKKSVADMLLQNVQTKRLKDIERNRQYVKCLIKILYFIITNRWAMSSFENVVKFIAGLEPPAMCQYKSTEQPSLNYTSSTIATELLECINQELEHDLLENLRVAPYYALLADESSDEAQKEQFAILVHFPSWNCPCKKNRCRIIDECDRRIFEQKTNRLYQSLLCWIRWV